MDGPETDADGAPAAGKRRRGRRPPRKITPKYLNNVALWYLERYASSAANLRRVLMRRVHKSCAHHGDDVAAAAEMVDELVARFAASGLIDDRQYAVARAHSLHRRGLAARRIRAQLFAKGLEPEDVAAALDALAAESPDPEFDAACAYARRRRLGPWGRPEGREDRREKELASMGRAGFTWELARRIIDADDPTEFDRQ
jgi:regulatory protein